ncbi:MAG: proline--tRNA ligase [Candidatus Njordarchaeales archaeon]
MVEDLSNVPRENWKKFSGWYEEILLKAEIYDYRYPVKGTGVWLPYGFELRERVYSYLKELQKKVGYKEVLFPTLIPEDLFRKESEHVASFEKEVFWVTKGGARELDRKYVLRPTSETAMYYMFSLWLNSYSDLPLKIFQVVNVFRYETEATHPLYREREITTFFESHSAFATADENEKEVKLAVEIYKEFFDWLGIPTIITKRPEWDKFPGAVYTIAFDTILPNGRSLQIGTVHNLGQNFSKAFDIKVQLPDGKVDYVWQMCFGVSGRVITALLTIHGDDHGPVFPPHVAPIQIVVIPIPYKGFEEKVLSKARSVFNELKEAGFRCILDDSPETPGAKYYKWELKGVPLRIEIGPKDIQEERVTIVRRDTLERIRVMERELISSVKETLEKMWKEMKEKALNFFKSKIVNVKSIDEAKKALDEGCVIGASWCGNEECGINLQEKIKARILGIEVDQDLNPQKAFSSVCIGCGSSAKYKIIIARSY